MSRSRIHDVVEYAVHVASVVVLGAGYLANVDPHALLWTGIPLSIINAAIAGARAIEKAAPAGGVNTPAGLGETLLGVLEKYEPSLLIRVQESAVKALGGMAVQLNVSPADIARELGKILLTPQAPPTPQQPMQGISIAPADSNAIPPVVPGATVVPDAPPVP